MPDTPKCTGTTKAGKPCSCPPIRGSNLCRWHSDGAKLSAKKGGEASAAAWAVERQAMRDARLRTYGDTLEDMRDYCAYMGEGAPLQYKARWAELGIKLLLEMLDRESAGRTVNVLIGLSHPSHPRPENK